MLDHSLVLAPPCPSRRRRRTWLPADVRLRLLAAAGLGFAGASIDEPLLVPAMLALAVAVAWAAGMGWSALARALRLPGLVVLLLVAILPFAGGETVVWQVGPFFVHREGLAAATLVGGRALAIVILVVALLGQLPAGRLFAGMRALGMPALMVDIAMLMQRYLAEIGRDLSAMRLAMRLRGQPWRLRLAVLRSLGWALAALLLRSHERAERIWMAMRLRGHGTSTSEPLPPPERADLWRLAGLALPALALVVSGLLA